MKNSKGSRRRRTFVKIIGFVCLFLISGCGKESSRIVSPVSLDGEYRMENVDNMYFSFEDRQFLTIQQMGIYELAENEEGKPIVRICLENMDREMPGDYSFAEYLLERDRMYIHLKYIADEQIETGEVLDLIFIQGTDGLLEGEKFSGNYQIGANGDDYQYQFKEDGSVILQIEQRYYAKDEMVTLSDANGKTEYQYEKKDERLALKALNEEVVLDLILQE